MKSTSPVASRTCLLLALLSLATACSKSTHSAAHDAATEEDFSPARAGATTGTAGSKSEGKTSSSVSTAGSLSLPPAEPAIENDGLPCAVLDALASNCQKCHSATPLFGAPMPLTTYADLQKPSRKDPSRTVAQLALERLNDKASPMPPGGNIGAADLKTLSDWFGGGAVQAPEAERACAPTKVGRTEEYLKMGVTAGPGETCYEFTNHDGQSVDDKTPYAVKPGEHYEQFYFKVPWGKDMVATKFATKFDNVKVVHHWLFFTTGKPASTEGTHETTVGTTIGDSSTLLAGWAVGGDNLIFPDDLGLELPESGMLNAQWHFFNQGDQLEHDASALQVCVVPRAMREKIAGITFLGTENLNGLLGMPAHKVSQYGGTCVNNSGAPITIWGFTPHMHKLGRHMNTMVKRTDGTMETVFDKVFDFSAQITYPVMPQITLQPGESIISTCTFDNITNASVGFGPSTTQEMCYNFTMSYPAKALDNGTFSLIGAKNTCW